MTHVKLSPQEADALWTKSTQGLAFVSSSGSFIRVNPAFCELLGFAADELLKMNFADITHPQDVNPELTMNDKLILGSLDHYIMAKRYITKTGMSVWMRLRVDAIQNDNGDFEYFFDQISPAVYVSRSDNHEGDNTIISPAPVTTEVFKPELEVLIGTFIKNNLRWLVPLFLSALSSSYFVYSQFSAVVTTARTNTETILENGKVMRDIQKDLSTTVEMFKRQSELLDKVISVTPEIKTTK